MEHLYALLLDACPDALLCLAKDGEIIFASNAFQDLFSAAPNAFANTTLEQWVNPADTIRVLEALADPLAHTQELVFSFRPRASRFSTDRLFEARLRPLPQGQLSSVPPSAHFLCIIRDISAQQPTPPPSKKTRSDAEFISLHRDMLIDMVPGIVWHSAILPGQPPKLKIQYISDYLERITGYTPKQWVETPNFWGSIIHPEDRDYVFQRTGESLKEGRAMPPYRIFAKDGRVLWFQSYVRTVRHDDGQPSDMFGLTLDVTEFKETEAAIVEVLEHAQALRTRLNDVIEGIPGIVWESWHEEDPNRERVNFCSEHIGAITGYASAEWSGKMGAWLNLIPEEERGDVERALRQVETQGQGTLEFKIINRKGQPVWLQNHIVCMRDEAGGLEGMRGIALDITAEKRAELERVLLEHEVKKQDQRISELSAPLIPVGERIIVMPLIGTLDEKRMRNILQKLLKGVVSLGAQVAVLDLTGLLDVNREETDDLLRAIQALELLGARAVLTGVQPELAKTLVSMDVDLSHLQVKRTLAKALGELMARNKERQR